MKSIVAILFVCLATGASAGLLNKLNPFSSHNEGDYDLEGLEKWLNKTAPGEGDKDLDHDLLRNNVGRFKGRKLESTAQLVLDVVDLKKCDQQALAKLNELAKAKLIYRGEKRTEKILKEPMRVLYETCGDYVDKILGPFSENLLDDDSQIDLTELISQTKLWKVTRGFVPKQLVQATRIDIYDARPGIWNDFFHRIRWKLEGADVKEMVVNKEKGRYETIYHRDRFDHVMRDYLLPSCESFMAAVGGKFDFVALEGLVRIPTMGYMYPHVKSWADFMSFRPRAVRLVAYGHTFCSFAPQLSKDNFNGVFKLLKGEE